MRIRTPEIPLNTRATRARVHAHPSGKKELTPGGSRKPGMRYVTRVLGRKTVRPLRELPFLSHIRTSIRTCTRATVTPYAFRRGSATRGRYLCVSVPIFTAGQSHRVRDPLQKFRRRHYELAGHPRSYRIIVNARPFPLTGHPQIDHLLLSNHRTCGHRLFI